MKGVCFTKRARYLIGVFLAIYSSLENESNCKGSFMEPLEPCQNSQLRIY